MVETPTPFDPDDPRHVATFDEAPIWSAHAGQLLLDHVPLRVRTALDLGCGAGFPLLELAERLGPGALVAGLDPWRAALARANDKRATWPVPQAAIVAGDGTRMPFRPGAFELIVSNLGVNNFADPEAALAECRRVAAPGATLALATNLVGHFRELYDAFAAVLARAGDAAAQERLRAHVAHRATVAGLRGTLARAGWRTDAVHERDVLWRFRDGAAVFAHHFMRLGFVPAWRDVAGGDAGLEALRAELDARAAAAGGLALSVPLAVVLARTA